MARRRACDETIVEAGERQDCDELKAIENFVGKLRIIAPAAVRLTILGIEKSDTEIACLICSSSTMTTRYGKRWPRSAATADSR
ncbi:hypothetical protein D3C72_2297360 [compost metagenome]